VVHAPRPAIDPTVGARGGNDRTRGTADDGPDRSGNERAGRNTGCGADGLPLRRAGTKSKAGKHDESKLPHLAVSGR
jgi:hypothetical protein